METLPAKRDWNAFGLFIAMLALNYAVITAVHAADKKEAAESSFSAQASGECIPLTVPMDARSAAPLHAEGDTI